MREVKINRVPFNPNGDSSSSKNNERIPFNPSDSELRAGDQNITQPTYTKPIDRQVDSAIDFLKQKGGRNGSTVTDSELDVLKDVLKDPRATQEQRKNAILTIQGYDPKHTDDNTMYYNKREANGVYMPTALAYGEKPPQGYHTASIWGNQNEANNDPWYLDLGKSLVNGVLGAAQGVVDVTQIGTALATGEESEYLNYLSNHAEALKFEKDKDLDAPIFNTEGITKFSDLLDKDRFDLSPKALWGSFNMAAESIVPFIGATKGVTTLIKGGKWLMQGLKGVDTALDLSKVAQKAAIFTGSWATQVGDVYDTSREAGLNPRDAAGLSTVIGSVMAAFDVKYGIDSKIMSQFFQNEKRALFKTAISSIEKDATTGLITPAAFKKLVKETSIGYGKLAKNGVKEVVKDAFQEGGQEAAQDFTQKAGEQLWDKMSDEDKAKFGTDALDAKSFGSYLNSFSTGLASGAPMAIGSQILKNKHEGQSINAYDRVKEGGEAVSALKADLASSVKNGDITPEEHDQAVFKIDSYQKYHEETKGVNLSSVDEKKAFELSFQIQGLKTEIPTNENEISKLDPISRSKVESKQKQAKELQSELNDIIRNGEIKGEPIVPKKEEERIIKEKEKESPLKEKHKLATEGRWQDLIDSSVSERELDAVLNQMDNANQTTPDLIDYIGTKRAEFIKEKEKESPLKEKHKLATEGRWQDLIDSSVSERELDAVLNQMDNANQTTPDLIDYIGTKRAEFIKEKEKSNSKLKQKDASSPNEDFPIEPKVEKKPEKAYITDKRTYKEVPAEEFNHSKTDDRLIHKLARKEIWEQPNHEVNGQLYLHQYEYNGKKNRTIRVKLEDGKILKIASSRIIDKSGLSGHLHTERLKGDIANEPVGVKVVELAPEEVNGKIVRKRVIKIYQKSSGKFLAYVKETHTGAKNAEDKRRNPLYSYNQIKGELEDIKSQHEDPLLPEEVERLRNTPIVPIIPKTPTEKAKIATEKIVDEGKVKVKEQKASVPLTITKAVRQQLHDLGFSKANIDNMKPEKALDIINKQEVKPKENGKQESANNGEKLTDGSVKEADGKNNKPHKEPIKIGGVKAIGEKERVAPSEAEQVVIEAYDKLNEELGYKLDIAIDYLEGKTDEELTTLAEKDKWEEGTDIITNESENEPFQKVSQRKGDITKVVEAITKAFKGINVEVNADKFDKSQSTVAGKVSADGKNIYLNPNYAGLDTPIHEAGHVLIDAMGYDNKVIQAAIKQLRNTPLYKETKLSYPELSEKELDKEVLAEAIGREGADIFDNVNDKSKFKQYLDYIFDWFKRKLGIEKNIAKSLAKQIISGVGTKGLKGTETGKEQLSKGIKKKNPIGPRPLSLEQYASEEGFNAQKEFDKYQEASVEYKEAESAEQDALVNGTLEEHEKATLDLKEASKQFAIKAKKYLEYKKYKKDFSAVQEILKDKDLDSYTYEELNDLITKLFSFNDKAAKSVKERAYQRLGHKVTVKQQEISKGKEGVIEALAKTSDISPLQGKILHHSHFSEKNADMQAVSLAYGKAIIEKLSEANSLKDTHKKLGLKVIQEENKRLGITGKEVNRFSSDSSKYFEWMVNEDGNYLTIDEAKAKGLSKAKIDYLDFHRETVAGYRESMSENDFENVKMGAIRVDKNFREAYKSEGLIPAFSYYLGGGATNLGRVRIIHNGKVMSYSEIEKEIIAGADKKSIQSMAKALFDLLVANIKARYQLKKGQNIDEKDNPLELKGNAEYSLNEKGQLVSKFDKPRAKDRGYSKDFYKAMNQFIDESAHVKHISKIMPLVEAVEYLNKNGYMEEGYIPKKNVSKWINDWKALHIFKEPHVNDPVIDAAVKSLRKLVASTTMWFNVPANLINVFMGNYNNWRAENAEILARGNARLFGGKGSRKQVGVVNDYALGIIKKYNLVNQDFDSHPVIKANGIFAKLATFGTQVGEYQIQGSLGLGLLSQEEFDSFEFTKDKYGNNVLTVKKGVDEDALKSKMTQIKNRVTDIQGKYPDEDRRNIMRGEFGKALFQFKVWIPDWFKERFSAKYINAYGVEKEGSYTKMLRVGVKEMYADLKKGDIKKAITNPAFVTNLKGMATIGALLALKHDGDDDDEKKKGGLNWDSALSQVLFIFDLEQDKYMVSNPAAVLGKIKDFINAFSALVGFEEDAWQKTKRIIPANKAITFAENLIE